MAGRLSRASRWPARLDLIEGASGLLLFAFMCVHMGLVSSILLSKDAMYRVARFFEGEFLFGRPLPVFVSAIALLIFLLVVIHAVAAMRRAPSSWREYRHFARHRSDLAHPDTTLWLVQLITGVVLMFFVTAHLYEMFMHPEDIGPHASAVRIASGGVPLGLILLFAVEIHGGIGVYRLLLKWGWFDLANSAVRRRRLRIAVWLLIAVLIALGLCTQLAYLRIGHALQGQQFEPYQPAMVLEASG